MKGSPYTLQRLPGKRCCDLRVHHQPAGLLAHERSDGGGELRTVGHGKTFFGSRDETVYAGLTHGLRCGAHRPSMPGTPHPFFAVRPQKYHEAQMSERRQIA